MDTPSASATSEMTLRRRCWKSLWDRCISGEFHVQSGSSFIVCRLTSLDACNLLGNGTDSEYPTAAFGSLQHKRERITFKLYLLVYKARNGMAPDYIQDLCVPVSTVSTRSALCSAARGDLVIPRTKRRLGNQAFSVAGPAAWSSSPPDIRTASTLCSFKNLLKTHLFFHSFQLST